MAVPKFKMSRARTHSRRSQWKANNADLVQVTGAVVAEIAAD